MTRARCARMLVPLLLCLAAVPAAAQVRLEPAGPVPQGVAEPPRSSLEGEKARLDGARGRIEGGVAELNAGCARVDSKDAARVADCRARNQQLREAIAAYRRELAAYKCALAAPAIDALGRGVEREQQALRQLGLGTTAAAFEQWRELTEEQRQDFVNEMLQATLLGAIDVGLGALKDVMSASISLNPVSVRGLVARAEKLGITNPHVHDALRAIGAARNKRETVEASKFFLEQLRLAGEAAYQTHVTTKSRSSGEALTNLGVLAMVFVNELAPDAAAALARRLPSLAVEIGGKLTLKAGLAVAPVAASFGWNMVVAGMTQAELERLELLPNEQLEAQRRLHERLKHLVQELKAQRAVLRGCGKA